MNYHYIFVSARSIDFSFFIPEEDEPVDTRIPYVPSLCLFSETKVLNVGPYSFVHKLGKDITVVVCFDMITWSIMSGSASYLNYQGSIYQEVWNRRFETCIRSIFDRRGLTLPKNAFIPLVIQVNECVCRGHDLIKHVDTRKWILGV